jgi:uncharacterized membrane protein
MSLAVRLRNNFVAGLFLVTPLAVTLFVLRFVFDRVAATLRPLVLRIQPCSRRRWTTGATSSSRRCSPRSCSR